MIIVNHCLIEKGPLFNVNLKSLQVKLVAVTSIDVVYIISILYSVAEIGRSFIESNFMHLNQGA